MLGPGSTGEMDRDTDARDTDHTDMTADGIAPEDRPTPDPANTQDAPDERDASGPQGEGS